MPSLDVGILKHVVKYRVKIQWPAKEARVERVSYLETCPLACQIDAETGDFFRRKFDTKVGDDEAVSGCQVGRFCQVSRCFKTNEDDGGGKITNILRLSQFFSPFDLLVSWRARLYLLSFDMF